MSIYICIECKQLHETKAQKKNCDHKPMKPKVTKAKKAKAAPKAKLTDKERYDSLIPNLDKLEADEVQFIASYLKVAFINKVTTVKLIKAKLGIE